MTWTQEPRAKAAARTVETVEMAPWEEMAAVQPYGSLESRGSVTVAALTDAALPFTRRRSYKELRNRVPTGA